MKTAAPALVPILRSEVQGRLLAAIFADTSNELSLTALARRAGTSAATAGREIDRAEAAGIVQSRRAGNTRYVRADPTHRLHLPLLQLITATWGVPAIVAEELGRVSGIDAAFIFGSWAARWHGEPGRFPNDVDVLVIGRPARDEADDAAERAEGRLLLRVQITVRSPERWASSDDAFLVGVRSRPLYELPTDGGLGGAS